MDIAHRKDNTPVKVDAPMEALLERASKQNFIPVVDDRNTFIGIVTRRSIIKFCRQQLFPKAEAK
jgi:CBS domain-containing protein